MAQPRAQAPAFAPSDPARRAALLARIADDSTRSIHMLDRGARDSADRVVEAAEADARALGDSAILARAMILRGGILLRSTRSPQALPIVLEGQRLAAAARDTATWMWGMRAESMIQNYLGNPSGAERLAHRWHDLAVRSGNLEYQAWARTMFGWLASNRGDLPLARTELEWAAAHFDSARTPVGLAYALNVLGNVRAAQGDYAAARDLYRRVAVVAAGGGSVTMQSFALANIGRIEAMIGDPAAAIRMYRAARAVDLRRGDLASALVNSNNLTNLAVRMGRLDEARAAAHQGLQLAYDHDIGIEIPWQRYALAEVLNAAGERDSAKVLWRQVLSAGDSAMTDVRVGALAGWLSALADQDSLDAALAMGAAGLPLARQSDIEIGSRFQVGYATVLNRVGRHAEALALARPLAGQLEADGQLEIALAAWTAAIVAERGLGRTADAARDVERATAAWERGRSRVTDLEFREMRGEQAQRLMSESVGLALRPDARGPAPSSEAIARAFAVAQRFKTRTLLERMAGSHAFEPDTAHVPAPAGIRLEELQRSVLAPGELLIEYVVGPDTTFVFAVTRDDAEVFGIPGQRALAPVLDLAHDMLSSAARDAAGIEGAQHAASRLGELLMGPLASRVARAGTLLIAPDGPLHRVPFAALRPGESGEPLVATHTLVRTPSATTLARLRERDASGGSGVLAVAGATGARHTPLPGARREVRTLASRYRDVSVYLAESRSAAPLTSGALAGHRGLHFAGHTDVNDQLPWRSGIVLGVTAAGDDSLLSADLVSTLMLGTPIVVLSSCESAGGRIRSGEGVSGLTSAFLAAGAPAVVATLWPVPDRSAEEFVERLYAELASGKSIAAALRATQLWARARPDLRATSDWAGFVVVGDGNAKLPLERRRGPSVALVVAVAAAIATSLYAVFLARRNAGKKDATN